MQDRGASLLLITASVPFSKEDENKGRNNHWVAGLIDLRDRTLYVMDSKRVAEVSRARILLNRVQRFWQRLGDDERSQGPVRAQIVRNVEQVRGDEHSCGPRVLDWIIRLMYFPRSILQGGLARSGAPRKALDYLVRLVHRPPDDRDSPAPFYPLSRSGRGKTPAVRCVAGAGCRYGPAAMER